MPQGAAIDRWIDRYRRAQSTLAVLRFSVDSLNATEQRYGQIAEQQILGSAWARPTTGLHEPDLSLDIGHGELGVVIRNALAPVAAVVAVVATRIAELLREPYRVNNHETHTVVSAGYAIHTHDSPGDGGALAAAAVQARLDRQAMVSTSRGAGECTRLDT